jgi:APA family basic amino acid/polyamine antiporter
LLPPAVASSVAAASSTQPSEPTPEQPAEKKLTRSMSAIDAAALLVGSMIGSGIFIAPSLMARNISAPGVYLGLWLLAGLYTLLGALSFAELAAMMPEAGGPYVYLRQAMGPLPGFLYGWTLLFVIQSGFIAAVAIAFAKYLGIFFPAIGEQQILASLSLGPLGAVQISTATLVALATIAVLTWVNLRGVEAGARVQTAFTGLKLLALWALIAAGLIFGGRRGGSFANFLPAFSSSVPSTATHALFLGALGVAASKALFCYDAWSTVTFAASEIRDPQRNLPRALVMGTLATTLTYVGAAAVYLYLFALPTMAAIPENRVAAHAARLLFGGDTGAKLIAAAILVSTFGCINGMILGGARVLYAMAGDGMFWRGAAKLNSRRAPGRALWLLALWSAALTLSGRYDDLLTYTTFASLLFGALTAACVPILRRKQPDRERPYRTLAYPASTLLFIAVAMFFVFYIVQGDHKSALYGVALVLLGLPVYSLLRRGQ